MQREIPLISKSPEMLTKVKLDIGRIYGANRILIDPELVDTGKTLYGSTYW